MHEEIAQQSAENGNGITSFVDIDRLVSKSDHKKARPNFRTSFFHFISI
jgi:hypothetical protein